MLEVLIGIYSEASLSGHKNIIQAAQLQRSVILSTICYIFLF
jgi:hypothetical protein